MVAVPDLDGPLLRAQELEGQGLGALLELPHLGLGSTVGPDTSVGPGADAVCPEGSFIGLLLEIEPESGLGRIQGRRRNSLREHSCIVDEGVADIDVGILALGLLAAAYAEREREVADGAGHRLGCCLGTVDEDAHGGTVVGGGDIVPLALPVGRERRGQRLLAARVNVEQQILGALLLEAELVLALGDEVSAAGVVVPRQEVEGEGKSGAGDLDSVSPVHLDPLVLLVQVDGIAVRALDEPGLAHDMRGNVVAGLVLEGADRLVETDADEVPEGSAHRLRMRIDDIPVVVHATAAVSGD